MRIYRASSLGGCIKAQIAEALGYEKISPPEQLNLLFREGDLHEGAVKESLRHDGYTVDWEQKTVNLVCSSGVLLQGHIDGRIVFPEKPPFHPYPMVLEVKSMGDSTWKDFAARKWHSGGLVPKYKWQLSAYMLATGLPGFFVAKNRNNGRLLLEVVKEPFYKKSEVVARVLAIDEQVENGRLPESCDETYPCPFYYLHGGKTGMGMGRDDDGDDTLHDLALRCLQSAQALQAAKAENEAARKTLRDAMGERKRVGFDDVSIAVSERRNVSFDREKMEANGVDPNEFEVVKFTEVMTVKKKEDKETDGATQG